MRRLLPNLIVVFFAVVMVSDTFAARISDIQNTKHNFSATVIPTGVTRTASASNESQICAFCHTPHGATKVAKAPLWNRKLSGATYIPYSSTSLDAVDLGQPGGKSKLCLSCHDGTIALGSVNVLNRIEDNDVPFSGVESDGTIPEGQHGEATGFTRRLGVDLTNDHPISFTFDNSQAVRDGELYNPVSTPHLDERTRGSAPALPQGDFLPLEDGKVECISCHDPHVRSDIPGENNKFLRVSRFQQQPPVDGQFDEDNDIICIACHDKDGWVGSAHAHQAVGDERYTAAAAELREFPEDMRVWQAACLNCHDPHTVQGSRRILREGTDGPIATTAAGARYRQGGNPAVEEVCWACHSADGGVLQGQISPSTDPNFEVPDIKTDFTTMARHMPIQSPDQAAGSEIHSIGTGDAFQGDTRGQDFIESPQNLGKGNLNNRHAECTDCHNPHRVAKNRLFNADTSVPDAAGTHQHEDGVAHTNIASGVLRGIWGVEPIYSSTEFGSNPVSFQVKRGDPGVGAGSPNPSVNESYLTREYQLCFKCHSNYSYDQPPMLGSFSGGTPPGTNDMNQYTNQAMEYQSPDDHKRDLTAVTTTPGGAFVGGAACNFTISSASTGATMYAGNLDNDGNCSSFVSNNHRAWHPIMTDTGRTPTERNASANVWRSPFNAAVGTQTMYCSDCHGSTTAKDTTVPNGGENGYPWGPHGSNSNFLLKGDWDKNTGVDQDSHLCFRCHEYDQYGRAVPAGQIGAPSPPVLTSGFQATSTGTLPFQADNLHVAHSTFMKNGPNRQFMCSLCHIAVPHGWKNKVFLANLNDVGLEAPLDAGETGSPVSRQVRYTGHAQGAGRYYNGPYYNGSALKVRSFAKSGQWIDLNCGSSGAPGNNENGVDWMSTGSEACLLPP